MTVYTYALVGKVTKTTMVREPKIGETEVGKPKQGGSNCGRCSIHKMDLSLRMSFNHSHRHGQGIHQQNHDGTLQKT